MRRISVFVFFLFTAGIPFLSAAFQSPSVRQISVVNIEYSQTSSDKFLLIGTLQNLTPEPREVILRGQLVFYDTASPKGDLPLFILRKDMTVILRGGESLPVEIPIINEGKIPRGSFRIEPMLRVRRQRLWNY